MTFLVIGYSDPGIGQDRIRLGLLEVIEGYKTNWFSYKVTTEQKESDSDTYIVFMII